MFQTLDPNTAVTATSYVRRADLDEEIQPLLTDEINVRGFFDALMEADRVPEALDLMTRVLPARYAIAWASECLERDLAEQAEPDQADRLCLAATKRWLGEPSEQHRRSALEMAERLEYATAGAWLAAAVAWSSGSIAPENLEAVPAPPEASPQALAATLKLIAAREKDAFDARLREFLELAVARFGTATAGSQPE